MSKATWKIAHESETNWWGNCVNTLGEQQKQIVYTRKMGLEFVGKGGSPYNIDMQGASVLDLGGGPCSLLLKCFNVSSACVVDPLPVPPWVILRYQSIGVEYIQQQAEEYDLLDSAPWDEVWIYNVLQHTEFPARVAIRARCSGKLVRVFEWINTVTNDMHPHILLEERLNKWFRGEGKTDVLKGELGCHGPCYYGIFKGEYYEHQ